ncbi:ABATE domain-containing protein [Streptomyces himastatinicus]|uniref:ABATE domain-containing protein n=1 Tax=Streptomyces himastatinicus TaxID=998084 RepID=UPI00099822FF
MPTPDRLRAWLVANELGSAEMPISDALLRDARELREAIHRAGTAVAADDVPDPADEACSTAGPPVRRWPSSPSTPWRRSARTTRTARATA